MTKRCSKCGLVLPLTFFYKSSKSKDGKGGWCKACYTKNSRERYRKMREQIPAGWDPFKLEALDLLGGPTCVKCEFDDIRALQVDHINGNADGLRGKKLYRHIIHIGGEDARKNYQVLCANCNWIKRYEENEWRKVE